MTDIPHPTSPRTVPPPRKPRDARLDFWRGLCLVDMVVVHLLVQGLQIGHYPHAIVGEYLRFAAGGFIFVAGMGVGRIFLPKASDVAQRGGAYRSLLARAFYILCVHYTATLGFMVFAIVRDDPLPPVWVLMRDIVLLRDGYDLLPFYVVMIALSPVLLEAIRRGWGVAVAVGSVALFLWGQQHYFIELIPIQQTFFVVLWQAIFVAGLLAGAAFPRYDALRPAAKVAIASGATGAALCLSVFAFGWHFGMPKPGWLWFMKVPLSGGEALRYVAFIVAIITVTDVLWRFIGGTAVAEFIARLGRRSLAMYVAHVFVVGLLVPLAHRWPMPMTWNLIYLPIAVVMLWAIAFIMDALGQRTRGLPMPLGRRRIFEKWPVAATAVALVIVLGVWAHLKPLPPGASYESPDDAGFFDGE
ncbi:MAG TPA: OpgC domain-containing protein [Tepidisphaeraceae bacterium]|nr:OpgC domain-containing protein [Tepidisphaeraceae bacterium]